MNLVRHHFLFLILAISFPTAVPAQDLPYVQHQNIVYAEVHGIGLVMDIFVPTGTKNGLAVVDVVSGAWFSDRGKLNDHKKSQTYDKLCQKGFTAFAIRPGSQTKFGALEMRDHLNIGIRWVKDHSKEYGIDPDRLGLMGASAGGHLACLTAVTAEDGTAVDAKGTPKPDTRVKAVAVFFPPTDFFTYGIKPADPRSDGRLDLIVRRLAFPEGIEKATDEEITSRMTKISPALLATEKAPPFLLIHGDADPLVPLAQSKEMLAALKKVGVPAELIVKEGGIHPWPTIHEEVQVIVDWLDKQLANQ